MNKFKQLLLVLLLCAVNVVFAQAPQMFTYQAVVRNASGQLIGNQIVGVKISILQGSVTGLPVYEETHLSTTNTNGLLTISVGNGSVQIGTFSSINWGSGLYFIKSEIDPAGGNNYTLISTTQMMSVPYALHANTADQLTTPFTESQILSISNDTIYLTGGSFVKLPSGFSGDYNDLTNTPTIPTVPTNVSSFTNDAGYITTADVPTSVSQLTNDAGYLTSFTESQVLSISNDTIYLTGGSYVKLPAGVVVPTDVSSFTNDAGYITTADVPTNVSQLTNDAGYLTSFTESQILSISNDTIYLTGGSYVKLPSGFSGDYNDLTNTPTIPTIPINVSSFTNDAGYITSAEVPTNVSQLTNDAGYLTSFTESQILSISNDTIYLTGGSFVKLPSGFSGDYNDLTNKPTIPIVPTNVSSFTNDAGYLTSFTESQVLTISNDTIYLTGGSYVKLPAGVVVPTDVSAFTNDAGYITNAEVPTNVSQLTNDVGYLTSFTESQILSISNDTIYLTGGSYVKLPAGFSGDYNDLTNKPAIPTVPTNISAFTNDVGYITSADIPAGFSGDYNDLTNKPTIPTNVSSFTNDAGYITNAAVPINVSQLTNDAGYLTSFTESQVLTISNDTIYLTGGSYVKLPAGFSGDYNDLTNKPTIPTVPTNVSEFINDAGYITTADVPTNVSQLTNDAGYLTSFTESQVLTISNDTIYLTGGSYVKLPAGVVVPTDVSAFTNDAGYITGADIPVGFSGDYNDLTNKPTIPTVPTNVSEFINDAGYITTADVPTNVSQLTNGAGYLTSFTESQILSISNDTIYLTGGSFVKLPSGFSGDYNDLTNTPTIPTVPTNVSSFTNDAGYLTSFTESQVLTISNDTIYLTGGSYVKLPAGVVVPTDVSAFTNDVGYITSADIPAGFSGDYNDLTNQPTIPTVPTNVSEFINDAGYITTADVPTNVSQLINDAGYLTSFTESQVLTISNDTIYLTGGSYVKLPAGVVVPTNISAFTNDAGYITGADIPAGFSGNYNDLTNQPTIPTVPTNVSEFINDAGYITTADVPTNVSQLTNDAGYLTSFTESQILSISNDTIYLTGGSFVKLPSGFSGDYNDLTNTPTIPIVPTDVSAFTNDAGYITGADIPVGFSGDYNDLTNKPTIPTVPTNVSEFTNDAGYITNADVPTNVSQLTNDAGYLTSFTESQVLTISNDTIYLTGGSYVKLPAGVVVPTDVSSFTNDAGYITSADIPASFSGDYNDLTNQPTIPTVPTNVSEFTNDAGYITSYTETQNLADVVASGNSAGNAQIKDVNDPTDPKDAVNLQYLTAIISQLQHQVDSLSNVTTGIGEAMCGELEIIDGALPGIFSISATKTVEFSRGNLQYTTTGTHTVSGGGTEPGTWRFAEHQYDVIGEENSEISSTYTGWIDLFGWGTSGWNSGAVAYQPYSTSTNNNDYNVGGTTVNSLTGSCSKADWGVYNAISNGGNQPGMWRTLTSEELQYIFTTRSQANRFIKASIAGKKGIIIFPDNYTQPSYLPPLVSVNMSEASFSDNSYNLTQWAKMEILGCVFLPITGARTGNVMGSETNGYYQTSTMADDIRKWHICFGSSSVNPGTHSDGRRSGQGVRLVKEVVTIQGIVINTPTVSTNSISTITYNSAISGGNVTNDGGADVSVRGVCWSTSANPTISGSHTTNGTGTGSFTSSITGLSPNTTYHVRAYATNSVGTAYGTDRTFTTSASAPPFYDFTVNGVTFRMIRVQGGTFKMGAQSTNSSGANYDANAQSDESPVHNVTLSSYYIGQTEVTQGLWEAVMGHGNSLHQPWNSTYGLGSNYPAYYIDIDNVQSFITQLNTLTGLIFRVPTEAEWEYAAKGGNQSHGYKYSGSNTIGAVAWYSDNSNSKTHPVATKQANELGLYDMSGNVYEWCQDRYGSYTSGSQTNPTGPTNGSACVTRGAAWTSNASRCRSTCRHYDSPSSGGTNLGLRLVLSE